MTFRTNDRVKETSTTTGTGNLTLAGAVSGFQAFSVFANDDTFFYAVVHQSAAEWEVGIGTYVSATPALARTTVLESSNADAAVDFSAGTKDVFVTMPAKSALPLRELAAEPAASAADWTTLYAFNGGVGSQIRAKDEHGLVDVLSNRDRQRYRRQFYLGLGSDALGTTADWGNWGAFFGTPEGTIVNADPDTNGPRKNCATAATNNADAGIPTTSGVGWQRDYNIDITVKFRLVSTAVRRMWIGFFESDHMAADSSATVHKFALRCSTAPAVTGFTIVHSDGTNETVESQIQAADANIHTIRLIADNPNSRFGYSWDGGAVVWITSNIPSATAIIIFQAQIRTLEAVAKNFDIFWIEGSSER